MLSLLPFCIWRYRFLPIFAAGGRLFSAIKCYVVVTSAQESTNSGFSSALNTDSCRISNARKSLRQLRMNTHHCCTSASSREVVTAISHTIKPSFCIIYIDSSHSPKISNFCLSVSFASSGISLGMDVTFVYNNQNRKTVPVKIRNLLTYNNCFPMIL